MENGVDVESEISISALAEITVSLTVLGSKRSLLSLITLKDTVYVPASSYLWIGFFV